MIKHVDELGRFVIPIEIRQKLDIKPYEELRVEQIKNMVIIQKYQKDNELENLREKVKVIEMIEKNLI